MASVRVYGLPHCSTCRKALDYLEERGAHVESFRDLKTDRLSGGEVRELASAVGGADRLFSRRARKYRATGLHERELGEDELLRLMEEEYTFVTRPVIVAGSAGVAGFAPRRIDALLERAQTSTG